MLKSDPNVAHLSQLPHGKLDPHALRSGNIAAASPFDVRDEASGYLEDKNNAKDDRQ